MASELTVGYESFSNLQLYKVNGIPILNLKHLCHVLDKLTIPHVSKEELLEKPGTEIENKKLMPIEVSVGNIDNETVNKDVVKDTRTENKSNIKCIGQSPELSEEDKESYISFDIISESNADIKREMKSEKKAECEHRENEEDYDQFSEYTVDTGSFYQIVSDDPLLLDCENFIHFELDKEKVIVLNISEAYTKSKEILKQYAITLPRSEDLPAQPY